MGLGREVDDRLAALAGRSYSVGIGDVALHELHLRPLEVRRVSGVGQLVEHDHVLARRGEALGEVRADETGPSGDQDAHRAEA